MHQSKTVPKNNEGHLVRVINFSTYTLTMGGENQDTERASEEVTVVVNIRIKPGCEKDYDEWLGRFLILERKVPGLLRNNNDHGNRHRFKCETCNSQI